VDGGIRRAAQNDLIDRTGRSDPDLQEERIVRRAALIVAGLAVVLLSNPHP
jgi:hypothetical protein